MNHPDPLIILNRHPWLTPKRSLKLSHSTRIPDLHRPAILALIFLDVITKQSKPISDLLKAPHRGAKTDRAPAHIGHIESHCTQSNMSRS